MKLYIKRKDNSIYAVAVFDRETGTFTVKKGSKVSADIAHSTSFRGAQSIERARSNGVVVEQIVKRDVIFKSASTAANFVTGTSTNGLLAWKDESGIPLKELLPKE